VNTSGSSDGSSEHWTDSDNESCGGGAGDGNAPGEPKHAHTDAASGQHHNENEEDAVVVVYESTAKQERKDVAYEQPRNLSDGGDDAEVESGDWGDVFQPLHASGNV
jgi:hypothetical protein